MDLSNKLSCEAGSFSHCHFNPHRFLHSEVLRLYFPEPEPWVVGSVSFSSCSYQFICTQMWDHSLHQPPPHLLSRPLPCCESSPPSYLSLPLLPVWMNVSSLTPFLWTSIQSEFRAVLVGFFVCLFLSLLLSFFWLCEEAQCIYLHLHLGWKSSMLYRLLKHKGLK